MFLRLEKGKKKLDFELWVVGCVIVNWVGEDVEFIGDSGGFRAKRVEDGGEAIELHSDL